ncbi:unnamed protein product [Dovyalis caffra]|uniref:Uncharacterized protein n=1 Tax=Dovyalis caffra TaxID=77055 RepID=A0AAV1R3K4_9ROSI|nr:unnamed protein product [Dovyalis caffra]
MGEALFDLEQVLKSQKETLTPEEANILHTCKSKAVRQFTFGVLTGGTVAWAATWKLSQFARANISGGAAGLFGFWRFAKSLDSCVDHILAMDGSRMQKELANIMANKYQDDPWKMQPLNRRFYAEKVFDDSNLDRPIIRLRYRNYFGDNVASGQRTHDSDSHDVSNSDSDMKRADVESKKVPARLGIWAKSQNHNFSIQSHPGLQAYKQMHSHGKGGCGASLGCISCLPWIRKLSSGSVVMEGQLQVATVPIEILSMNLGAKVMEDPLESIFGFMEPVEEIHHPGASGKPARVLNRSHKRSHQRMSVEDLEAKPLFVLCHAVELELSDKFCKHLSFYSVSNSGEHKCLYEVCCHEYSILESRLTLSIARALAALVLELIIFDQLPKL